MSSSHLRWSASSNSCLPLLLLLDDVGGGIDGDDVALLVLAGFYWCLSAVDEAHRQDMIMFDNCTS